MRILHGFFRPLLRLQFSLVSFLLLTAASPIAIWHWYYRSFPVEQKLISLDPICLTVSPQEQAAILAQPRNFREVQYVRRVAGGETIRHGPYRGYDLQDNLLRTGYYRDGVPHGRFASFSPAGQKLHECTYVRGQLDGDYRTWNQAGQRLCQRNFCNGKEQGVRREWEAAGVLTREETYERGLRHGPFTHWTKDGGKCVQGAFQNNLPSGLWTWFPSGGTVASITGQWQEGLAHGRWQWMDPNGRCLMAAEFDRGQIVNRDPDILSPRVFEQLVVFNSYEPARLAENFAPALQMGPNTALADVASMVVRLFYYSFKLDDEALAGLSRTELVPNEIQSEPALMVFAKMLKRHGLGYDLRHGAMIIDRVESIATWQDATGVSALHPPVNSKLDQALQETTYLHFVEMPLQYVLNYLFEHHSIEVRLRNASAQTEPDIGNDVGVLVTMQLSGLPLRHALGSLLTQIKYRIRVQDDGLVVEPQ